MKKVNFSDKNEYFIIRNREQEKMIHVLDKCLLIFGILFILLLLFSLYKKNYILALFFFSLTCIIFEISNNMTLYDKIIERYFSLSHLTNIGFENIWFLWFS